MTDPSTFYLATATVIPVLWIGVGFATAAVAKFVDSFREQSDTPRTVEITAGWSILGIGVSASTVREIANSPPWLASLVLTALLLSGVIGEGLSLVALCWPTKAPWIRDTVFGCTLALLLLCSVVLKVSMQGTRASAADAEALVSAPSRDGGHHVPRELGPSR